MTLTPRMEYAPASSFGWLDHDAAAADRMREVLAAFSEKSTVDSLGFGVVRDALANRMFPGTSTIQTRARYFFFVPWVFQHCEGLGLSARELDAKTRELELDLIESLRAGVEKVSREGIIGGRARRNTKRLASSVYWSGLATFGFRLADLSPSELRRLIPGLRQRRASVERDDNRELVGVAQSLWARIPEPPDGFPYEPITFALTEEEAAYLAEAIQTRVPDSVLACLVMEPEIAAECEAPWDVPNERLTPELRDVVEQARRFSLVSHGANVLYNVMLCEAATRVNLNPENADPDGLSEELEQWGDEIRADLDVLRPWAADLSPLWAVVERDGPINPRTKTFVERWTRWIVEDPARAQNDPTLRQAIQERERAIKTPPRLSNTRALERWNGAAFGRAAFAYRFGTVQRFMNDIAVGLGRTRDAVA